MIRKCSAQTLSKKKLSEFDTVLPCCLSDENRLYFAGVLEDADGNTENVKVDAQAFQECASLGSNVGNGAVIEELTKEVESDVVEVKEGMFEEQNITYIEIDATAIDFLQISKVTDDMFVSIQGKKYLCIALKADTKLGSRFKLYLPDYPFSHGLVLVKEEMEEVFYAKAADKSLNFLSEFIQVMSVAAGKEQTLETKIIKTVTLI